VVLVGRASTFIQSAVEVFGLMSRALSVGLACDASLAWLPAGATRRV